MKKVSVLDQFMTLRHYAQRNIAKQRTYRSWTSKEAVRSANKNRDSAETSFDVLAAQKYITFSFNKYTINEMQCTTNLITEYFDLSVWSVDRIFSSHVYIIICIYLYV